MKKFALCGLALMMSVTLCACGTKAPEKSTEGTEKLQVLTGVTTEKESSETKTEASTVTTSDEATIVITDDDEKSEAGAEASYPGTDVVEVVNLRGDEATLYKLADGRYMDRIERVFTYNGTDAWFDENGVEWNEKVN